MVSVISARFEDCCCVREVENRHRCVRRQRAHIREDETGGGQVEAKRRMLAIDGAALLIDAMIQDVRTRGGGGTGDLNLEDAKGRYSRRVLR